MEEKETVPCFILKLPLRVDSAGRRVFARDFLYALQLRNATLGTVLRRDRKMKQSDEWKEICRLPKGPERNQRFQKIRKDYGLSSANDFEKILKEHAERSGRKNSSTATWGRSLPTICIGLMRIGSSIRKDVPDSAGEAAACIPFAGKTTPPGWFGSIRSSPFAAERGSTGRSSTRRTAMSGRLWPIPRILPSLGAFGIAVLSGNEFAERSGSTSISSWTASLPPGPLPRRKKSAWGLIRAFGT